MRCVFAAFVFGAAGLAAQSGSTAADPMERVKQARALNNQGRQAEAVALYNQALQTAPDLYEAHLGAGIALDLEGQYDEARRHLRKAVDLASPKNKVQALKTMAISYAFESKPKESEKFERQVFDVQIGAKDYTAGAETANELARIYLESGDSDNAYKWYNTGHKTGLRTPELSAAGQDLWDLRWEHAQARIAARRGIIEEARQHVTSAKTILDKGTHPEQARFYPYLVGYVAFYSGAYSAAIAELQKLDQHDPATLLLLAQAYEKTGDRAQAADAYRKILEINSHNPPNAFARPLAKKKAALA